MIIPVSVWLTLFLRTTEINYNWQSFQITKIKFHRPKNSYFYQDNQESHHFISKPLYFVNALL